MRRRLSALAVPVCRRLARAIPAAGAAALLLGPVGARGAGPAFGLDQVAERARVVASLPFEDPRGQIPRWLLDVSYDAWRKIRFRPEMAVWKERRIPFTLQFFHPGLYYDRRVVIHEIDAAGVHPIPFSPERALAGLVAALRRRTAT